MSILLKLCVFVIFPIVHVENSFMLSEEVGWASSQISYFCHCYEGLKYDFEISCFSLKSSNSNQHPFLALLKTALKYLSSLSFVMIIIQALITSQKLLRCLPNRHLHFFKMGSISKYSVYIVPNTRQYY